MAIFGRGWLEDNEDSDDGPMFGGADRREEKARKKIRAKEIASGLVMGTFERDEEVWAMVKEIKEKEGL
jgi:hypothetical protein